METLHISRCINRCVHIWLAKNVHRTRCVWGKVLIFFFIFCAFNIQNEEEGKSDGECRKTKVPIICAPNKRTTGPATQAKIMENKRLMWCVRLLLCWKFTNKIQSSSEKMNLHMYMVQRFGCFLKGCCAFVSRQCHFQWSCDRATGYQQLLRDDIYCYSMQCWCTLCIVLLVYEHKWGMCVCLRCVLTWVSMRLFEFDLLSPYPAIKTSLRATHCEVCFE